MRNALRTFVVGLMVVGLTFPPAMACHFCDSAWTASYYGGGCCGGEVVVYDDCGGGCGSCDSCDGCGGCDSCEGTVVETSDAHVPQEAAPEAPAEAPVVPQQPATVDRPIEESPAPSLPPAPQPEQPAEDLFNGSEAAAPPAETAPVETAPIEEAAPVTPPPAEAPVETPGEDDLFGGATETPPADTSATPPAAEPATGAEDDLFGTEGAESAPAGTEEAPAETPTETPAETAPAEEDDIFNSSRRVLEEKGGLASSEMRMWVDNTGTYSCHGRLVRFMDGHVRILKDNGRTTTVPFYRLSPGDLSFVNRQASAQKSERMQTAQVTVTRAAN